MTSSSWNGLWRPAGSNAASQCGAATQPLHLSAFARSMAACSVGMAEANAATPAALAWVGAERHKKGHMSLHATKRELV